MRRLTLFSTAVLIGTFFMLFSCGNGKSLELSVVISGNNRLKLEPCGCSVPIGGLARKMNYIDSIAKNEDARNTVILEGGNWLFHKQSGVQKREKEYLLRLADLQAQAYSDAGYAAVNIGSWDCSIGLDYLLQLSEGEKIPFLSANLLSRDGSAPFPEYILLKEGAYNILVTGVIQSPETLHPDFILKDAIRSLQVLTDNLMGSYDFSIVFFDGPPSFKEEIDSKVRGVDVIVDVRTARHAASTGRLANSCAVSLGQEGKYLGLLHLKLGRGERAKDLTPLFKRMEFNRMRIERYNSMLPERETLEQHYSDQPQLLEQIRRYIREFDQDRATLDTAASYFAWESIPLGKDLDGYEPYESQYNRIREEYLSRGLGMPQPVY